VDEITCCRYEDFARSLADETRQAILELLMDRELNVGEIAAHFDLSQPTISYHLGLLRRAGVVLAQKKGRYVYIQCQPLLPRGLRPALDRAADGRQERFA